MSTITGTSDTRQSINGTVFRIGDTVQSNVDGRVGRIVTPDNLIPVQILPLPAPPTLVAQPFINTPTSVPAVSPSNKVKVAWTDKTFSVVSVSTLQMVSRAGY